MKLLSLPLLENGQASMSQNEIEIASPPPLRTFTTEEQRRMQGMISTLLLTQKRYGISPQDLQPMTKAYLWALRGYEFKDIYRAVESLIKKMPDIPTPADIIGRIDELKASTPCLPATNWWIAALGREIGEIPARSWFKDCTWNEGVLTAPNQFYAEFIRQNYKKALDVVFKEWQIG